MTKEVNVRIIRGSRRLREHHGVGAGYGGVLTVSREVAAALVEDGLAEVVGDVAVEETAVIDRRGVEHSDGRAKSAKRGR